MEAPWPRLSSAIARRPARVSVATQPGWTQLTAAVEAKPWIEHDRLALAFVEEGDLDAVVLEALHRWTV